MSSVVPFRSYIQFSAVPTLVLVDLQQEYIAHPRGLALHDADIALEKCREALIHARIMGFPVAFVRWVSRSAFFNTSTRFCRWIEGFEPSGADMVFERDKPSCYASEQFSEFMNMTGGNIVLAGFSGEAACLSTAIDSFHRGHSLTYLTDASASHALDDVSAGEVHRFVGKLTGVYADVSETREWITTTTPTKKIVGA